SLILIRQVDSSRIRGDTMAGGGGASIVISIGRNTIDSALDDHWVMTHEMIHCTFPSVDRSQHAWIEEGIATYIQPLARLRAGQLNREKVWSDLLRFLPEGLPQPGDQGLDNTPTCGRTYWGGALF